MKKLIDREVRFAAPLVFCMSLALFGFLVAGCMLTEEPVDPGEILSRIHEGDDRQRALDALSDAWYHSECGYVDSVEDILFFGSKHPDRVTIVVVRSSRQDGQLKVDLAGTVDNYFLDTQDFGRYCEPPLKDAFK
jgi:hypothetical protein